MSSESSQPGLRERKKAVARANVLEVSHRLFRAEGFDSTTIEQICSETLISKRTFFRYFRDKESLVFPNREERLSVFVDFLEANRDVDNPFESLRLATRLFGAEYNKNKNKKHLRDQQWVIHSSLALLSREREIDQDWQKAIADAFSARAGNSPESDLWARVLAGAIMGVVRSTMTFWFDRGCDDDLTQLGLDALNYLEQGFPHRAGG
jgi:AcrR family transcriptional regulator